MELRESVQEFLAVVIAELGEEDAAAMFAFLSATMKSNKGKLKKLANVVKDPENLKELQSLSTTKNKLTLLTKISSLYKKIS